MITAVSKSAQRCLVSALFVGEINVDKYYIHRAQARIMLF